MKEPRLLCTESHELIHVHHPLARIRSHVLPIISAFYSRKLLKFVCPVKRWASHASSSHRLPVQHSTYPAFNWKAPDVASKFPLLRSAGFSPRFHVAYLNHFSHTLCRISCHGSCQQWDDMLKMFCRYKRLGAWELAARDGCNWETLMPEFIIFCSGS